MNGIETACIANEVARQGTDPRVWQELLPAPEPPLQRSSLSAMGFVASIL
jgi:hypothetical protein